MSHHRLGWTLLASLATMCPAPAAVPTTVGVALDTLAAQTQAVIAAPFVAADQAKPVRPAGDGVDDVVAALETLSGIRATRRPGLVVFGPPEGQLDPLAADLARIGWHKPLDLANQALAWMGTLTVPQRDALRRDGALPLAVLTAEQRALLFALPGAGKELEVDGVPLRRLPAERLLVVAGVGLRVELKLADGGRRRIYLFRESIGAYPDYVEHLRRPRPADEQAPARAAEPLPESALPPGAQLVRRHVVLAGRRPPCYTLGELATALHEQAQADIEVDRAHAADGLWLSAPDGRLTADELMTAMVATRPLVWRHAGETWRLSASPPSPKYERAALDEVLQADEDRTRSRILALLPEFWNSSAPLPPRAAIAQPVGQWTPLPDAWQRFLRPYFRRQAREHRDQVLADLQWRPRGLEGISMRAWPSVVVRLVTLQAVALPGESSTSVPSTGAWSARASPSTAPSATADAAASQRSAASTRRWTLSSSSLAPR